jgi:hypothetical protein
VKREGRGRGLSDEGAYMEERRKEREKKGKGERRKSSECEKMEMMGSGKGRLMGRGEKRRGRDRKQKLKISICFINLHMKYHRRMPTDVRHARRSSKANSIRTLFPLTSCIRVAVQTNRNHLKFTVDHHYSFDTTRVSVIFRNLTVVDYGVWAIG